VVGQSQPESAVEVEHVLWRCFAKGVDPVTEVVEDGGDLIGGEPGGGLCGCRR
jgi:hypothetical protein